jgi:hypothetical protein
MRHQLRCFALILFGSVLVTSSACENGKLRSPAVPTPSVPVPSSLAISRVPTTLAVGDSVQLTASVTLPDGTQKSSDAVWTSSNDSVATVSSTGFVTILGQGGVNITATAYDHESSVHLRAPFAINGVVHETLPTEDTPVAGARVEVQGGSDGGISMLTDSAGRFSIDVEAAGVVLSVSKDGYDPSSLAISALPRDERANVALMPVASTATTSLTGGICADPSILPFDVALGLPPCLGPVTGRQVIRFHRAGAVELDFGWEYRGRFDAERMLWEVDCGGLHVRQEFARLGWNDKLVAIGSRPLPWRFSVAEPGVCEIKPSRYYAFEFGVAATDYRITATHPR